MAATVEKITSRVWQNTENKRSNPLLLLNRSPERTVDLTLLKILSICDRVELIDSLFRRSNDDNLIKRC